MIRRELEEKGLVFTSLFRAKPLAAEDYMDIGYIVPSNLRSSEIAGHYLDELRDLLHEQTI